MSEEQLSSSQPEVRVSPEPNQSVDSSAPQSGIESDPGPVGIIIDQADGQIGVEDVATGYGYEADEDLK